MASKMTSALSDQVHGAERRPPSTVPLVSLHAWKVESIIFNQRNNHTSPTVCSIWCLCPIARRPHWQLRWVPARTTSSLHSTGLTLLCVTKFDLAVRPEKGKIMTGHQMRHFYTWMMLGPAMVVAHVYGDQRETKISMGDSQWKVERPHIEWVRHWLVHLNFENLERAMLLVAAPMRITLHVSRV